VGQYLCKEADFTNKIKPMTKRVKGIAVVVACLAILVWGLSAMIEMVIVRYWGQKTTAVVTAVPTECDRYNHITVLLDNTAYEVSISRDNCREGIYKVGQEVDLLKHENYEELIWPESQPEIVIILIIAVLILGLYTAQKDTGK
jgi:hypothetical protein